MCTQEAVPQRWIGLDAHKHYLVAVGVDADKAELFRSGKVPLMHLESWAEKTLQPCDALVIEMSTNTFDLHDRLVPYVHSVTVVHPPHVKLVTQMRVKTDYKAARNLARLHAADLFERPVWVPPQAVRDLRAIVAQRRKMVSLATQAKNRLHAVLHRHRLAPPEGSPFAPAQQDWWLGLPVSASEQVRILCDWQTLTFAQDQVATLAAHLKAQAAADERVPLLIQLPGIALIAAMTLLAAIGNIGRFPTAKKLVGYAGLGAAVHDSGQSRRTGKITKTGRRDLRATMVEAAQAAANTHPHWQAELARLEPRLGRNKAIVAIARKLLIAVWHVLTQGVADRFAQPERVARNLLQHTYRLGRQYRPAGQSAAAYVRDQLDRLQLGQELDHIPWGQSRRVPLPPPAPG